MVTGSVEPAVRAGSSKEWTLEQSPECTRLITAQSSSSPGPVTCCKCRLSSCWQCWAGLERNSKGHLA